MTEKVVETSPPSGPRYGRLRYVSYDYACLFSLLMEYSYNGVEFRVLVSAAAEELPTGYELEKSIEGKPLSELNDLACNISLEEEQERMFQIQREFGKLVGDAC